MKQNAWIVFVTMCVFAVSNMGSAQETTSTGRFSLVTSPRVMVYIDGRRVGMSPLINHTMETGAHKMALLLILPNGNRLRADYKVVIDAQRETFASLNLSNDAPEEGEVRVLAPTVPALSEPTQPDSSLAEVQQVRQRGQIEQTLEPPMTPQVSDSVPQWSRPPQQPQTQPIQAGGSDQSANVASWGSNPGRPSAGPVTVAPASSQKRPLMPTPPPTPPSSPEPERGLTREMVQEGLESLRPAVERCMNGKTGVIQIRMVIQTDGGIQNVQAQGAYRGTRVGDCIEQVLPEEAIFPIYSGEPIPVVYPYRIVPR